MDTAVTIINLVTTHLQYTKRNIYHVILNVHKKLPQYTEMMEILFTPVINNKDFH